MKLRTVTLIWWAVLMLGAVAWCRAQDRENVTQIISHYADTDSAKGISISFNGPSSIYPRTTLTLDSLVVLWDEYERECYADSELVETHPAMVGPNGECYPVYIIRHEWIHAEPTFNGFMSFIRRKAGE